MSLETAQASTDDRSGRSDRGLAQGARAVQSGEVDIYVRRAGGGTCAESDFHNRVNLLYYSYKL